MYNAMNERETETGFMGGGGVDADMCRGRPIRGRIGVRRLRGPPLDNREM